jgi:hypothetical protein
MSREVRLLSTCAISGYRFPEASPRARMDQHLDTIGVDGSSVEPCPHYYGCQHHAPLLGLDLPV